MKHEADTLLLKEKIKLTKPTSRNPAYNSHLYWSQKSFNIIDIVIEQLSDPGDIVFDPFMGSGVTLLEAAKEELGRNAVGVDVNEMPTFIVNTLLNDMLNFDDEKKLNQFSEFLSSLAGSYDTTLANGEVATITKVLFDKPKRTENIFVIKQIDYKIGNEKGKKIASEITYDDYQSMATYQSPLTISNTKLIPNSKIAVGTNDHISDLFTPRNFSVLNKIVEYINQHDDDNLLRYLLMSILHLSKITDTHSNSQWPLWIPKTNAVEKNVVELMSQRINNIKKTISFIKKEYSNNLVVLSEKDKDYPENQPFVKVLLKGSQNITDIDIPDDSIDLVITDPPYMDQVLYSEYMQLYQPFLNFEYNLADEIVVSNGKNRNKNKNLYFELLNSVFSITASKAKEDSYMALYFHDSSLSVWNELLHVLEINGFKYITQQHIPKTRTLKNILSPKKSLSGDAILLFQNTKTAIHSANALADKDDMIAGVLSQAKLIIEKAGRPLSTPELYDMGTMEFIIQNGWLASLSEVVPSLVEVFEEELIWLPDKGLWTINNK